MEMERRHWSIDFKDLASPAIIVLRDPNGKKGSEGGGFVFCPMYGKKMKAFTAGKGTSNSAIISKIVSWVFFCVFSLLFNIMGGGAMVFW